MAFSRDLVHWERPFRTPCISRNDMTVWDRGFFMSTARALRVRDEIWLYYDASNFTHGAPAVFKAENTGRGTTAKQGIGLARWKLDRFVAAGGPRDGGSLTTVPIVFNGERLEINAAVKPGGRIRIEVLDPAGRPLQGFGASDPFTGDNLRHTVTWSGQTAVARLLGKPVTLRFHLEDAQLYSYAFRPRA